MTRLSPVAAILLLGLAGCAGEPTTSFYTLDPVAAEAASQSSGAATPLVVTVSLPEVLDRAQVVRRSGAGQLVLAPTERWAAPLDDLVRRALARDLAMRLSGRPVSVDRPDGANDPAILRVAIDEFAADQAGRVSLEGRWSVTSGAGQVVRAPAPIHVAISAADASTPATVQAMSAALAQLGDQIAADHH
jgi:uncharacterized protein